MSDLRIAVIIGSTRPGRVGPQVASWVMDQAKDRPATYDLIDLADVNLPFLDEAIPPSMHQYQNEHTKEWAEKIGSYDGFIFVTSEYNHSYPAPLKNAIDYIYAEWNNKSLGLVGYGSLGGARSIEHLRGIAAELQLADVRQQLSFSLFTDFENFSKFTPGPQHTDAAQTLFGQVEAWAGALKPLRNS